MNTNQEQIKHLRVRLSRMTVYRKTLESPVLRAIRNALEAPGAETVAMIAAAADECGFPGEPGMAVREAVLYDDNALTGVLSRAAANNLPPSVLDAALFDLQTLESAANLSADDFPQRNSGIEYVKWEIYTGKAPLCFGWEDSLDALAEFYRANGTGIFAKHRAFLWNGQLVPVSNPDPVRFCDFKGYTRERAAVDKNIKRFLKGLPANNMLLYGDHGTGKSATVHSLVNEYCAEGLRLIELSGDSLSSLPRLSDMVKNQPLRFLFFLDDLTFSESGREYAAFKAILEGSLETLPENTLLCATSNRRHLIRQHHSDRSGNEIHLEDTLQEQHSLSDRFGITVTFLRPNKDAFLSIVAQLAADAGINMPENELFALAEQWAIAKGGRSPRAAVQFIRTLR